MLAPQAVWAVIAETPVCESLNISMTLLTGKGIVSFPVEVFSLHPGLAGFGLFLRQA